MLDQGMSRMRDAYLQVVLERMRWDSDVFFLTADFGSPVLDILASEKPERFINVGIAEQNLINLSTGLALEGFTVVAYAIAPFITMRCYEQIRVNLAILSQIRPLNVNLVGVGAGFSYDVSGPTHQALEDLSIMRTLPNLEVLSPSDASCAEALAAYALDHSGPKYFRLDGKPLPNLCQNVDPIEVTKGFRQIQKGSEVCLVATGYMTHKALQAAALLEREQIRVGVVDLFNLSRFDSASLRQVMESYRAVLTLEEAFSGKGGLDTCILQWLNDQRIRMYFDHQGLASHYRFDIGDRDQLLADVGLDERSIAARVKTLRDAGR